MKDPMVLCSVRLDRRQLKWLMEVADAQGITVSDAIRDAIDRNMKKELKNESRRTK